MVGVPDAFRYPNTEVTRTALVPTPVVVPAAMASAVPPKDDGHVNPSTPVALLYRTV